MPLPLPATYVLSLLSNEHIEKGQQGFTLMGCALICIFFAVVIVVIVTLIIGFNLKYISLFCG